MLYLCIVFFYIYSLCIKEYLFFHNFASIETRFLDLRQNKKGIYVDFYLKAYKVVTHLVNLYNYILIFEKKTYVDF